MKRVKLIVAYDGTNYCGWQSQKEAEEAIRAYAKKQAREAVRARIAERGRRSEDRENSTHRRGTGKWERRTGMRFMHLSDLHIGKRVNEFSMLEDQRFILKQILDLARQPLRSFRY